MATSSMQSNINEALWRLMFESGHPKLKSFQRVHRWLPSPPRCRMCFAPFRGIGGVYMRLRGKGPANRNPNYCSACDTFIRAYPGKAEVPMSMVIVDLVGSKELASRMTPSQFGEVLNNFYAPATNALSEIDGYFIQLKGDEVDGVFPPGFSGSDYARKAVQAAEQLLRMQLPPAPDGSPVYVKVGVHTGIFCIGTVGGDKETGVMDVGVMGENVHITQQLAKAARPSEALITEAACTASRQPLQHLEFRQLKLEGRQEPVAVRVMRASAN